MAKHSGGCAGLVRDWWSDLIVMKILAFALLILSAISINVSVVANAIAGERLYQHRFCKGMELEITTGSGARADCVSDSYAIEVDFSDSWANAIGQALHYASELKRKAGIVLVCNNNKKLCTNHGLRLESTIKAFKLPITVWYCQSTDKALADCFREDAK